MYINPRRVEGREGVHYSDSYYRSRFGNYVYSLVFSLDPPFERNQPDFCPLHFFFEVPKRLEKVEFSKHRRTLQHQNTREGGVGGLFGRDVSILCTNNSVRDTPRATDHTLSRHLMSDLGQSTMSVRHFTFAPTTTTPNRRPRLTTQTLYLPTSACGPVSHSSATQCPLTTPYRWHRPARVSVTSRCRRPGPILVTGH